MPILINPWRDKPVHRIGVYTEHGLSPWLVERFLKLAEEVGCRDVVDPFVGSGVVAVESQKACMNFLGIDANPWSLVLAMAKTRSLEGDSLLTWLKDFAEAVDSLEPLIPSQRLTRYHSEKALTALGRLRRLVELAREEWKPLLLAALGRVANEYSLLRRSPAPRFRRATLAVDPRGVYRGFMEAVEYAVNDLRRHHFCGVVDLVWGDSTVWLPRRVCGLLTSPPFANNIDYVRHTMVELLWAGFARDSAELGALRSIQVPACEATARAWREEVRHSWIRELVGRVGGKRARGYRRFLLQYFRSMERHLELLSGRLEWQAWYTIGDSFLGGAYIPVHEVLKRLAEEKGLHARIEVLGVRYRPGRRLYLLKLATRR